MERLNICAKSGDVETLYAIIAEDPYVLERIDGIPFIDTPLHVAAAAGNNHFAMEMMNLKPSFARKLNCQGLSPIHLALQNSRDDLVRSIITIDSELVRVKSKGMVTPLHFVAEIDKYRLLAEFLYLCPSSIEDLTVKCENAVHIAVKNKSFRSFKVLLEWLRRSNKEELLKWKDDDDNTVLHIAVATNQMEVMELLIPHVNVNAKNLEGKTAMDIFNPQDNSVDSKIGKVLHRARAKKASDLDSDLDFTAKLRECLTFSGRKLKYLRNFGKMQDRSAKDLRNIVLVVTVLIAAAAYQGMLSPPDVEDEETSKVKSSSLFYFAILNSLAFYVSVCTILLIVVGLPYFHILAVATNFLSMAYAAAMYANWPSGRSYWYPWLSSAFGYSIFLVSFLAMGIPLQLSYTHDKEKFKEQMAHKELDEIPRRQMKFS